MKSTIRAFFMLIIGTFNGKYNFKIYFDPFLRCFVQGYNLRGDRNKPLYLFTYSRFNLPPEIDFFLSNRKFFIVN